MKLSEYLEMKKVPAYKWAKDNGISQGAIYAWIRGDSRPLLATVLKIQKLTGGDVRPDDWINGDRN